jgi:LPS sulfotransferase NodH
MAANLARRLKSALRLMQTGRAPETPRREIPAITLDEVAEAKSFFPLNKYFIFGHARSGTTLLTRLVRLHPQVHCNYQGHFFTRAPLLEGLVAGEDIGNWLGRRSNRWNRGQDLSPVVLRAASDFIMERDALQAGKGSPGCVVGDKSPNSLLDGEAVRLMVKVYPEARLVFIIRDGRDAAVSHRFQAFIDRPQHLSAEGQRIRQDFSKDPEPFLTGQRSLFTDKELRLAAEGWVHNVVDTDRAARELLGDRYYALRYEDMLAQPWESMRKLWGFLGVDPQVEGLQQTLESEMQQNPDAEWQQQKSAEIAGSLQKGRRGTWRELFTDRDRQIFKQAAGETLMAWGYENSMDW